MNQLDESKLFWPPIISGAGRNFFLKARDIILTLVGWAILEYLLVDFWILIYNWIKPPFFVLLPEDIPNWNALWQVFHPFVFVSAAIMCFIIVIAIWRRRIISRTIEHYYLTPEDEADLIYRESGLMPSMVQEWHRLRDVDVEVDDEGNISQVIIVREHV